MKKVIISLLAVLFLFSCANPGNETGNVPDVPNAPDAPDVPITGGKLPGKFSATVLSDAMGSNARGISLGAYTVANSKSIYFLLRNVGDFPITEIHLTPGKLLSEGGTFEPITDNGITASPGTIAVLETSGNATVETVIEVDINHGNVVGLISQQYIQKADFAGATLRITGKTINGEGAALDVSLDADIETLIKVASFEVHYSIDNGATYTKAGLNVDKNLSIPNAGKDFIKILNTGNVPLRYKATIGSLYDTGGNWENNLSWKTIEIGSYSNALVTSETYYIAAFVVDTIGVAFDKGEMNFYTFRPNTSTVVDGYDSNRNGIRICTS